MVISVAAPAKINLHLEIVGRRWDGFHEIRTLLQSIDLFDRLWAEPAPPGDFKLAVDPPGLVDANEDNLVLRAAHTLADATGVGAGAALKLEKKIPVCGGLGGGSADAAATLVLLTRLWDCGLDAVALHRLAGGLGSDVPFFLHGGLAFGVGRGTEVFPLPDQEPLAVVVTVPNTRVSSAQAYGRLGSRLTSTRPEGNLYAFAAGLRGRLDWRVVTNELEEAVVTGWPEVGEGLRILRSCGSLHASLSGSGAASYAVFDDPTAARRAAAELPSGWFVHVGETLQRRAARLTVESVDDGGWR